MRRMRNDEDEDEEEGRRGGRVLDDLRSRLAAPAVANLESYFLVEVHEQ